MEKLEKMSNKELCECLRMPVPYCSEENRLLMVCEAVARVLENKL